MNKFEITQLIRNKAFELGFDLVGFSKADYLKVEGEKLRLWLNRGFSASMSWIAKTFDKRVNPNLILPEAKSIISLGLNYYQKLKSKNKSNSGKISVYAWGKDYHKVIEKKFKQLDKFIKQIFPESKNKYYVDYGPTLDKAWAVRGGLGWMGKHTNVINPYIGSWFFIGTVITTIEFEYDEPISDMCGSCRICIDACPTNAIVDEYLLDANLCISYQTIENKNDIPTHFKGKLEGYIFGCDICQEVCPWNIKLQIETSEDEFASNTIEFISKKEIFEMNESEFKEKFRSRAILRAGLEKLKKNFLISEM